MFVTLRGKRISYEVVGQGEPILLVHGWGGSSASLKALSLILSQSYQIIVIDLPGFGHSDNPEPTWGVEEYAHILTEFLDQLKLKKVDFFGHSFGGALGIYIASQEPNRINKLILCAPSYSRLAKKVVGIQSLKQIIPPDLKLLLYRIFFPNSDISRFPKLEQNFRKIVTQDLTPLTHSINVPTFILWGEKDTYVPVEQATNLHARIKKSILKIFPDVKHSLPLKNPDLVAREVKEFLDKSQ